MGNEKVLNTDKNRESSIVTETTVSQNDRIAQPLELLIALLNKVSSK